MIKLIDILNENLEITPDVINKILKQTEREAKQNYNVDWDELTPEMCNQGFCDDFANNLRKLYPGAELWQTYTSANPNMAVGHVWVEYKGKHYDAETPNGVDDWRNIPHIQRVYKAYGKYPTDVEVSK
jgi:hypothetical protein